jgi:hypothetical protein
MFGVHLRAYNVVIMTFSPLWRCIAITPSPPMPFIAGSTTVHETCRGGVNSVTAPAYHLASASR